MKSEVASFATEIETTRPALSVVPKSGYSELRLAEADGIYRYQLNTSYFDAGSAEVGDSTSFTVASGQLSEFQRSGMIARVAFPSIRTSPSKSDVNQVLPSAVSVPACPGPINGPLVVARNTLPPLCNISTPTLSRYGPVIVVLRPMRML